jgi:hypothetical protein
MSRQRGCLRGACLALGVLLLAVSAWAAADYTYSLWLDDRQYVVQCWPEGTGRRVVIWWQPSGKQMAVRLGERRDLAGRCATVDALATVQAILPDRRRHDG